MQDKQLMCLRLNQMIKRKRTKKIPRERTGVIKSNFGLTEKYLYFHCLGIDKQKLIDFKPIGPPPILTDLHTS